MATSGENDSAPAIEFTDDISLLPKSVLIIAIRMGGNVDQLEMMLNFMAVNRKLVLNDLPTRMAKKTSTQLWNHLSNCLNALGCVKSTADWRKFWSTLTVGAKARYIASKRPVYQSNNTVPPINLGYYDDKVLEILQLKTPLVVRKCLRLDPSDTVRLSLPATIEKNHITNTKADNAVTDIFAVISEVNSNLKDTLIMVKDSFDRLLNATKILTAPYVTESIGEPLSDAAVADIH